MSVMTRKERTYRRNRPTKERKQIGRAIWEANGDTTASDRDRPSREHYSSRPDRGDRDDRRDRGERRDRDQGGGRRRSRSPHRSRRDYEVDTYSSSRGYREREREDRYAGRERPDDRGGWDRDRGRRDDERPARRDRDLFDDRRGGGGGGRRSGGDRDGGQRGQQREKSKSPPPKKKEPTPDLTDVVPILQRKRRLTQWDIKPPGYDNVTAEQAKLSGMFPLPGAPRQQPMDPSRLQAFMNQPAGEVSASVLKPSNARQSKRLFAYNLPPGATESSVAEFFNLQLNGLNVVSGIDPCISAQLPKDGRYALLEFKSSEDATMALALNGISITDVDMNGSSSNGDTSGLSIRRPADYIAPALTDGSDYMDGVVSHFVKDSANKVSITHIPTHFDESQVRELAATFGDLRAFVLVKDMATDQSRGIAFVEYTEPSNTDIAVEGLNGMEIGDAHLRVVRASVGSQQASGLEMGVNAMSMLASTASTDEPPSRVIQLLNMVTAEELMDPIEYAEISADVREECEKFGEILDFKVPRPMGASRQSAGVGKIFVKYADGQTAAAALRSLAGRKFADRTVVATFFGEEYFDVNAW